MPSPSEIERVDAAALALMRAHHLNPTWYADGWGVDSGERQLPEAVLMRRWDDPARAVVEGWEMCCPAWLQEKLDAAAKTDWTTIIGKWPGDETEEEVQRAMENERLQAIWDEADNEDDEANFRFGAADADT